MLTNSVVLSQTISGTIIDQTTNAPVPFASVGFAGKHTGTLGDEQGRFEFRPPAISDTDSLKITAIGYTTLTVSKSELAGWQNKTVYLKPAAYNLAEIKVKPKNVKYKTLGTSAYSKKNCTAFIGENSNWKGEQVSILAGNKEGAYVYIEEFAFYIIKNEYHDSLKFRLMLYTVNASGFPGPTFLEKPVVFKTLVKQGEVRIDLRQYNINTSGNFFISLECLEEKMESAKFCFAGSYDVASFYKTTPFGAWGKVRGGGADLNVLVSYVK
ncbi:MAG: carboxypeptidase-like regulatory domain-containing protein [Bacteroidia bacterium]